MSRTRPSSRRTRSSIACEDRRVVLEELLRRSRGPGRGARRRRRTTRRSSRRSASRPRGRADRPSREMPSPYMTSNSASRNGGATLFLTTLTRVRPPTTASPSLMLRDAADVDADRGVELQRAAAGRRFGIAEHHADLLAQLVDEDEAGLRLRHDAGELAQRLRHQPRLQAHLRFAHLAFDFGLAAPAPPPSRRRRRRRRSERIEHFDDLERLLAVVRLRDQQVVEIDAELLRVLRRRARARRRRTPPCRRASALRR